MDRASIKESSVNKLVSEFLGTCLLVCIVVGSGIMATNLSQDIGVQLLINAVSTVFGLMVLIQLLMPISGAHFNPVVTLINLIQKNVSISTFIKFSIVQTAGAITGAILANAMFNLALFETSTKIRSGSNLYLGEVIATAGLILVINLLVSQEKTALIPVMVASWIGSAYFFTSSTSFANPAVTVGRIFSESFAGIAPSSVLQFIAAQIIGALLGLGIFKVVSR
ncbi:MAG: aquaporin family protein [Streptomycetaceae bacterium]|jgi:glycerol uptake facilitator-like aquaporin|nr:aquaporin family protein [Streptomycetaceae bacterium]